MGAGVPLWGSLYWLGTLARLRAGRPVVKELDVAVPKDWDIIVAGGHCFSFAMTHLRGRPAGKL
jgi:hypothetical protein